VVATANETSGPPSIVNTQSRTIAKDARPRHHGAEAHQVCTLKAGNTAHRAGVHAGAERRKIRW